MNYYEIFEELDNNVQEALKNASENGYDFLGFDLTDIAEDMARNDSAFEGVPIDVLYILLKRHIPT